jgi:hypothetical protein
MADNNSFVDMFEHPVVFMHEINTLPAFEHVIAQVPGILKYDRVVSIAGEDDIVLLKNKPEKSYLNWLNSVNLGSKHIIYVEGTPEETLPNRIIKNGYKLQVEKLIGHQKGVVSPYYGGPEEENASNHLGLPMYANTSLVLKYDSKIRFKSLCKEINVPVIEDYVYDLSEGKGIFISILNDMIKETGKVIIRGEFGASASTTHILDSLNIFEIRGILEKNHGNNRLIIEPFYETLSSPSSVWFLREDKGIKHLRTSNQVLENGISHAGNEFPVRFDEELVKEYSVRIARHLSKEGFIGPFGIDYIETEKGMFATECNPRMTGAIYPWEIVSKLEKNEEIKAARSKISIYLRKMCPSEN